MHSCTDLKMSCECPLLCTLIVTVGSGTRKRLLSRVRPNMHDQASPTWTCYIHLLWRVHLRSGCGPLLFIGMFRVPVLLQGLHRIEAIVTVGTLDVHQKVNLQCIVEHQQ